MSRLLIISPYFHPDRGGGSAVNTDLCHGLAERGHEVTVWTTSSHYPEWRDKTGENGWRICDETLGKLKIVRFGLFIPRNPASLWQRMLYEASFFLSALRRLWQARHHDALMAFCPLVSAVGIGALAALLFRKPLWLNVQDLAAEAAAAGGILKRGLLSRFFRFTQAFLFNRASVWSTISPVMVTRLEALRWKNQPVHHLPNWLNESLAREIEALPSKLGRPPAKPIRLLYAGNFGRKQNLVALLDGLKHCQTPFEFRLHGDGADVHAIKEWFAEKSDSRFILGPFLGESAFAKAIHDCDVFVLPEIEGSGVSFLPSKLTAVIASGTPVLCLSDADSPLGHEITSAKTGPLLRWEQLTQLDTLLRSMGQEQEFLGWQQNARFRSAFFDRSRIIKSFFDELEALAHH